MFAAGGGCETSVPKESGAAPQPPIPDPAAMVRDIEGIDHALFERADVRAVAMVFIMHDCPIANAYAAELNRLHAEFKDRGVQWFLMHVDPQLTEALAREHAAEYLLTCPIVLDSRHDWVRTAGATRTPEAAVFSSTHELLYRGRIDDRYVDLGKRRPEATTHDLRDALEAILADKPVPQPRTEAIGCDIPKE